MSREFYSGPKLRSPKPVWSADHATSWVGVEKVFSSCWFATWSLTLPSSNQDLPSHFCWLLREPILFLFSSIFCKRLLWKPPFWSGYNPYIAQTLNHQNFPITEGSQALSVPSRPSHQDRVMLMEERESDPCIFHASMVLSWHLSPLTYWPCNERVQGLPDPLGKSDIHLLSHPIS